MTAARVTRALTWLVAVSALLYGAAATWLWLTQERLLFFPTPLAADHRFTFGDDVSEAAIDVPGARLSALHLARPDPEGLVFFLHGNAGSLETWFVNTEFYRGLNYDLFMFDYRGFGKSTGRIESQSQLEADTRAAWDSIAGRYAGKRRVVLGRSLGTGLAARLSVDVSPETTVLVSPYTSLTALAAAEFPWLPRFVLRYPLTTDAVLPRVRGPVWLIHGAADTFIPPSHSERLKAIAPAAELVIVPGAGHDDLQRFSFYVDAVARAISGR